MLRLVSAGGAVEEFQWSTSEQVYPFEKGHNGETLYAKFIDFGNLPNSGTKQVSHNISNFREFRSFTRGYYPDGHQYDFAREPIPQTHVSSILSCISISYNTTNVTINTGSNRSEEKALVYLIYSKTA